MTTGFCSFPWSSSPYVWLI